MPSLCRRFLLIWVRFLLKLALVLRLLRFLLFLLFFGLLAFPSLFGDVKNSVYGKPAIAGSKMRFMSSAISASWFVYSAIERKVRLVSRMRELIILFSEVSTVFSPKCIFSVCFRLVVLGLLRLCGRLLFRF